MITVLADQHLFEVESIVPDSVELKYYDSQQDFLPQITGADALLIRTVTKLPAETVGRLPDSVSFIGTASAGTDHVDIERLSERGIAFANSAGCNARSVAEYVTTALLIWTESNNLDFQKLTVGIIGAGNTGSALNQLLEKINITTIIYDPPKARREPGFSSCSTRKVLSADVLSFHTPLTRTGAYPTYHWLDEQKLQDKEYKLIVNASRGGVVDEQALLNAQQNGSIGDFIIDVWENEPEFSDETAQNSFICTPHIAGYSIQAKRRATRMVVQALCNHFSIKNEPNSLKNGYKNISDENLPPDCQSLAEILKEIHPIKAYQERLQQLIGEPAPSRRRGFNELRTNFPMRHEYGYLKGKEKLLGEFPILKQLGIQPC